MVSSATSIFYVVEIILGGVFGHATQISKYIKSLFNWYLCHNKRNEDADIKPAS